MTEMAALVGSRESTWTLKLLFQMGYRPQMREGAGGEGDSLVSRSQHSGKTRNDRKVAAPLHVGLLLRAPWL